MIGLILYFGTHLLLYEQTFLFSAVWGVSHTEFTSTGLGVSLWGVFDFFLEGSSADSGEHKVVLNELLPFDHSLTTIGLGAFQLVFLHHVYIGGFSKVLRVGSPEVGSGGALVQQRFFDVVSGYLDLRAKVLGTPKFDRAIGTIV